jgi:hypothetical protein
MQQQYVGEGANTLLFLTYVCYRLSRSICNVRAKKRPHTTNAAVLKVFGVVFAPH